MCYLFLDWAVLIREDWARLQNILLNVLPSVRDSLVETNFLPHSLANTENQTWLVHISKLRAQGTSLSYMKTRLGTSRIKLKAQGTSLSYIPASTRNQIWLVHTSRHKTQDTRVSYLKIRLGTSRNQMTMLTCQIQNILKGSGSHITVKSLCRQVKKKITQFQINLLLINPWK